MSWFLYGDQKSRAYRKGIWLRVRSLPEPLLKLIVKELPDTGMYSGPLKSCQIEWIIVDELKSEDRVLLEVWSSTHEERLRRNRRRPTDPVGLRYTVFHVCVKEDPEWVCEGDLGRGYVKPRKKRKRAGK